MDRVFPDRNGGFGLHLDGDSGNLNCTLYKLIAQFRFHQSELGRDRAVLSENNDFSLHIVGDRARSPEVQGQGSCQDASKLYQALRLGQQGLYARFEKSPDVLCLHAGYQGGDMQIIVVSSRLTNARPMSLSTPQLVVIGCVFAFVSLMLSAGLLYVGLRYANDLKLPYLSTLLASAKDEDARRADSYMRENLNAMAVRVGQMQAQLVRLDALGERLATLAGIKPSEFRFSELPGRGGALPSGMPTKALSMEDFEKQLEAIGRHMENRTDVLGVLEARLFDAAVKQKLLPTITPVETSWSASSFGWRIDPISGMQAMHEGVDFIAPVGTPIVAAAGGIVITAEHHPQYGNMVEIDHGNDFTTRYAHASRTMVKVGDVVQRGAKIAEVGTTGRTTGAHLHFEVRYRGVAQNPTRFLQQASIR